MQKLGRASGTAEEGERTFERFDYFDIWGRGWVSEFGDLVHQLVYNAFVMDEGKEELREKGRGKTRSGGGGGKGNEKAYNAISSPPDSVLSAVRTPSGSVVCALLARFPLPNFRCERGNTGKRK